MYALIKKKLILLARINLKFAFISWSCLIVLNDKEPRSQGVAAVQFYPWLYNDALCVICSGHQRTGCSALCVALADGAAALWGRLCRDRWTGHSQTLDWSTPFRLVWYINLGKLTSLRPLQYDYAPIIVKPHPTSMGKGWGFDHCNMLDPTP